jgi:hypothetical protein
MTFSGMTLLGANFLFSGFNIVLFVLDILFKVFACKVTIYFANYQILSSPLVLKEEKTPMVCEKTMGVLLNTAAALSGADVLVERLAHGTLTGIEFTDHAFDLLAKAGLVEVDAEDILAAEEGLQTGVVLVGPAQLERGHDGLQFGEHGVG